MTVKSSTVFILFALILIFVSQARASSIIVPKNHFFMDIRGSSGGQWYKIFQESGSWICVTQDVPYFEAKENPLHGLNWDALKRIIPQSQACSHFVNIRDTRQKTEQKASGCLDAPAFQKLAHEIGITCRVK